MLKIGLTQRVHHLDGRGERRDCLHQAWTQLLIANRYLPVPLPNLLEDPGVAIRSLGLSGVILTGGNDLAHLPGGTDAARERDTFETRLLDYCREADVPALGVCRGLQLMVVHYGGTLSRVEGHVAVEHPLEVSLLNTVPFEAGRKVNSYHKYGVEVEKVGPHLQVAATAQDGTVEAIVHRDARQWAVMWHPERPPQHRADGAMLYALFKGKPA